jgi:hypothetical protein
VAIPLRLRRLDGQDHAVADRATLVGAEELDVLDQPER